MGSPGKRVCLEKGTEGSNPSLSAIFIQPAYLKGFAGFLLLQIGGVFGLIYNKCYNTFSIVLIFLNRFGLVDFILSAPP